MKKQKNLLGVLILTLGASISLVSAQATPTVTSVNGTVNTPTTTTDPNSSTVNGTVNTTSVGQTVTPTTATTPGMPNTGLGNDNYAFYLAFFLLIVLFESALIVRNFRSAKTRN